MSGNGSGPASGTGENFGVTPEHFSRSGTTLAAVAAELQATMGTLQTCLSSSPADPFPNDELGRKCAEVYSTEVPRVFAVVENRRQNILSGGESAVSGGELLAQAGFEAGEGLRGVAG